MSTLDSGGDPKYGSVFVVITGDSALSFDGTRLGVYFTAVSQVMLLAGRDSQRIGVRMPINANSFLTRIASGSSSRLLAYVRFTNGQSDKYSFSLAGLKGALSAGRTCARGRATQHNHPTTQLGFASFMQSDIVKQHDIRKGDGWALRDGLFNNSLKSGREPAMSIEMSTRADEIVHVGIMVNGATRPDVGQLQIMKDILSYVLRHTGASPSLSLSAAQFTSAYQAIRDAPVRRLGSLRFRTGSVGGDAILSVDISPQR